MTWQITDSGGGVAWGKNHDPPQGAYAVWQDIDSPEEQDDDSEE
jgi:hypothetical protein